MEARRAGIAGELFKFTGKIAVLARFDDSLWAACYQIASMLKTNVVILLPNRKTRQLEILDASCSAEPQYRQQSDVDNASVEGRNKAYGNETSDRIAASPAG